jgi:hypothetical protein
LDYGEQLINDELLIIEAAEDFDIADNKVPIVV